MNRGPLIFAIVLLLLPVLYVGSYLVLVRPPQLLLAPAYPKTIAVYLAQYRLGGEFAKRFFWPLEQIDRKVRPGAWQPFYLEHDKPW